MSEPKLISPLLDHFVIGDPISDHDGVRCLPAMDTTTEEKYIVKIISVPASQTQLDALLLTGVYSDAQAAKDYFKGNTDQVEAELRTLEQLSRLEGFLPVSKWQIVEMDEPDVGYEIYILTPYQRTLERHLNRKPMTHLGAVNLGLDLCSALSAARRSGYLYVDLKPSNIFLTGEQEYRIGDLGFIPMNELRFTSLPDKYRSAYTSPEIADAFSALNTTIDIYAAGLILYRCYNNGQLPFATERAPAEQFPAPEYADYEMSEIILKACDPNPEQRYQDPVAFAQALVGYMQRNGANDEPIVPPVVAMEEPEEILPAPEELEGIPSETGEETAPLEEEAADGEASVEIAEEAPETTEDEEAPFLVPEGDETTQALDEEDIPYEEVTEEVSQILSQADELAAHPVPEPAVAPEAIEVPMPEPIVIEPEEVPSEEAPQEGQQLSFEDLEENASQEDSGDAEEETEAPAEDITEAEDEEAESEDDGYEEPEKQRHTVRTIVLILLGAALVGLAFLFYKFIYLCPIDTLKVDGSQNGLTVSIETDVDLSDLYVTCSTYGSKVSARFSPDGKAQFTELIPNTQYKLEVQIDGFRKTTGSNTATYYTPATVSLEQISCVTGATDGSALIRFTPSGSQEISWTVRYQCEGQPAGQASAENNTVTLEGLQIGSKYTIEILPDEDVYLTGENTASFIASPVIRAQDLRITHWKDNALTVGWAVPEGAAVSGWSVHCYDADGYNQVLTTVEPTATFQDVDPEKAYTIEVMADGQSVFEPLLVERAPINIENFKSESDGNGGIKVTWEGEMPEGGWVLKYEVSGFQGTKIIPVTEASASIPFALPGRTYTFTLEGADGSAAATQPNTISIPEAQDFTSNYGGFTITREDIVLSMCTAEESQRWESRQVAVMDRLEKTQTFAPGDSAALATQILKVYDPYTEETVTIAYVVIGANGQLYSSIQETLPWPALWNVNQYRSSLSVPELPQAAGEYTLLVYFNGGLVTEQAFTIQ